MKRYISTWSYLIALLLLSSLTINANNTSFGFAGGLKKQTLKSTSYDMLNDDKWISIGGFLDTSLPMSPISIRGELNYAWRIGPTRNAQEISLIPSAKFSISPAVTPFDIYIGAGPSLNYLIIGEGGRVVGKETYLGAKIYSGIKVDLMPTGQQIFIQGSYGMKFIEGTWNEINVEAGVTI